MQNLENLTKHLKELRGFNVDKYIIDKTNALREFFYNNKLSAVVVPISGGVDSAVVLALMHTLLKEGVLKQVMPIFIPINYKGITGQKEAAIRAEELCERFDFSFYSVDGTEATESIIMNSCDVLDFDRKEWAYGQVASIVRTPIIYYHAAILQTAGYRSIGVGTTNRDEGSYIGFYGKASDGMNDLQPIADIHKSEVYQLAEYFKIPKSIINEKPKGDVWDSKNDEEMIGAPYWFLELYLLSLEFQYSIWNHTEDITVEEKHQMNQWMQNIEKLHEINSHKYKVGMPAHFVDVMTRKIPGGWQ